MFAACDAQLGTLHAVVHNAGQYLGVTSDNARALGPARAGFGEGADTRDAVRYYQALYGEAYVDLCERALPRMPDGGALVGVSSPGCTLQYKANLGYDLPGAGKCVMEYAMRLFALRSAARGVRCNVVIPGVTATDAWDRLAAARGASDDLATQVAQRLAPMGLMAPRDIGAAVAFLCSPEGRWITGVSLPVDGGVHLKC